MTRWTSTAPLLLPALVMAALLAACPAPAAASAGDDSATLHRLRAERRATSRLRNSAGDKSGRSGLFGLLVIPVDFADARLPAGWKAASLADRLTAPAGESLTRYFAAASGGRVEVRVTLAPTVSLAGTRRDYSDRDLQGFTRTRALATEALTAVGDLGLEFRRLDMDGPDLVPGTADDDGQVDGVLILHAAPGQENDVEAGLIQPLQFYLDEPVVRDGVAASFFAVASMHSGPGIWAHETAHLLGLEDRYDPLLPSEAGEVTSRGGLGRFSLMGSGAWGTGGGWGAALPDAYSRLQMGWIFVRDLPPTAAAPDTLVPGEAARAWTRSETGPEFFLLETRDPAAAAPFDAAVPSRDLLVYHVDETVPEGSWSDDGFGEYHLRVRLVEADDDRRLQDGLDDGRAEDQFPGPLGRTAFGPATIPASDGYGGPTTVAITGIEPVVDGIVFAATTAAGPGLAPAVAFESYTVTPPGERVTHLTVIARETGPLPADLQATVAIAGDPAWGAFDGAAASVLVGLRRQDDGRWLPTAWPRWYPDTDVPPGARTDFTVRFVGTGFDSGPLPWTWVWGGDPGPLDFAADWPGEWVVDHPDGQAGTTWFRWDGAPFLTADGSPVLACVDSAYSTSTAWPNVTYGNGAHATLTSGPLGDEVRAVRMVHAVETETLAPGEGPDGALVVWVAPDGREVPAVPADGYPGRIGTRGRNPRHGAGAFIENRLELEGDIPLWRTDIFPVPDGPGGPWRLRLVFASNPLWRARGWFVASLDPLADEPESAFPVAWDGTLTWDWPFGTGERSFTVVARAGDDAAWTELWTGLVVPDPVSGSYALDGGTLLAGLPGPARVRHQVRVTGAMAKGLVGSRTAVVYPDGGDGQAILLAQPWPNPGRAPIRFQIDVPVARAGKVSIFDVRGRLVRRLEYPAGSHLGTWDGKDSGGRLLPSGAYFLRLEGSGPVTTRKVVLLH